MASLAPPLIRSISYAGGRPALPPLWSDGQTEKPSQEIVDHTGITSAAAAPDGIAHEGLRLLVRPRDALPLEYALKKFFFFLFSSPHIC